MSDKAVKFSSGNSIETIKLSSDEYKRGYRSEMPLYYDDWLIDEEMLDEALKPFTLNDVPNKEIEKITNIFVSSDSSKSEFQEDD